MKAQRNQMEEAEYRAKIIELQNKILDLQRALKKEKEEKEQLEKEKEQAIEERNKIKNRFNELLNAYKEVTSERALLNQVSLLREQMLLTLMVAFHVDTFTHEYVSQIKQIWEDIKGIYEELKNYIENKIIPAPSRPKNQVSDQST